MDYVNYENDPIELTTGQDVTSAWANAGDAFAVNTRPVIGIRVNYVVNDSDDVRIKVFGTTEVPSGGTDFDIDASDEKPVFDAGDSDGVKYFEFRTGMLKYVQVKVKAGTVGATPGSVSIVIE